MTVTSFDDVTDILLIYIKGEYKSEHARDLRFFPSVLLVGSVIPFGLFLWLVPQLVHLGSHRPSHLANSVPLKEWNYNQTGKCSLFVQIYVLKVIMDTFS